MLSIPCKYSLLSDHFINSFFLSFSAESIKDFLENSKSVKDLIICKRCKIAPKTLIKKKEGSWICKCGQNLNVDQSVIKKQGLSECFGFIEPESPGLPTKKEVLLLCCLDYSGTMSTSYNTPNKNIIKEYAAFMNSLEASKLSAFGGQFNISDANINRKSIMLFHLKQQIEALIQKNSNISYKIFVITFANEVKMFGDGVSSKEPVILEGENFEKIKDNCKKCLSFGKNNYASVYKGKVNLDKLFDLLEQESESGSTSLGPAIAVGLGVVHELQPDACQFLIFTDGQASNGIGNIEHSLQNHDQEEIKKCNEDYDNLGKIGFDLGVIFHMFAFGDVVAGFNFTTRLVDKTVYGNLNRVEIRNNSYDDEKLNADLKTSFELTNSLFAIPPSDKQGLKIFYDKRLKLRFCQKNQENSEIDKDKKDKDYIFKNVGPIYNNNIKIGVVYEVPLKSFKVNEIIPFQIQLNFIEFSDKLEYTLIFNFEVEIKSKLDKLDKNLNVDFNALTNILLIDKIEEDQEKLGNYIDFMKIYGKESDLAILSKFAEKKNEKIN